MEEIRRMYYDKYLLDISKILKGITFEYSNSANKEASEVYNKLISSFSSLSNFSYWHSLSEKQRKNAFSAFEMNGKSEPIAVIDDTLFKSCKGGVAFLNEEICTKFVLRKADYVSIKNFATAFLTVEGSGLEITGGSQNIKISSKLIDKFRTFQRELCINTPYNTICVDNFNELLKNFINDIETNNSIDIFTLDFQISHLCRHVKSIFPESSELISLRLAYLFLHFVYALEISSYGKVNIEDSISLCEVDKDNSDVYIEKFEQIKTDYLEYHYENEFSKAKQFVDVADYSQALHRVKESRLYIDKPESRIFEIEILLMSAKKDNQFNVFEISSAVKDAKQAGCALDETLIKRISDNKAAYDAFVVELKNNMSEEVKSNGLTSYLIYDFAKLIKDKSNMNVFMYMALYNKTFDGSVLTESEKNKLLNCRNCFGHSIVDIASLHSFQYYYNLKLNIDMEFKKRERNFKIKNTFTKGFDIYLKASDKLADHVDKNVDTYVERAINQGDLDAAISIYENVGKRNFEGWSRDNAGEANETHQQELFEKYMSIQNKVIKDVKRMIESGGIKNENLLSIYREIPIVVEKTEGKALVK